MSAQSRYESRPLWLVVPIFLSLTGYVFAPQAGEACVLCEVQGYVDLSNPYITHTY